MDNIRYKDLSADFIKEVFRDVPFKVQPLHHQAVSFIWALDRISNNTMFLHSVGTGKTFTALWTAILWGCKKILVVCPASVIVTVWNQQIEEHTDLSATNLVGKSEERKELLKQDTDVYVINYEGLKYLFGRKQTFDGDVKKFIADFGSIPTLLENFDCLICDEIHRLKARNSIQTKLAYRIARHVKNVIMMTGTPIDKTELDLWSEYFVLDDGQSLGRSYWRFVDEFFEKIWFNRGRGFFNWKIKANARECLLQKLEERTLRYAAHECVDLPEKIYQKRYVQMSKEQQKLYKEVKKGIKTETDNQEVKIFETSAKSHKLLQIPSGFILKEDGSVIKIKGSIPKLEELLNILVEIDGQVIVFHRYVEEGRMIESLLKKKKIRFRSARGEIKNKDKQIMDFKENESIKVLVAHPVSGGVGQNLQNARAVIFYSNDYSSIVRQQAEGRIYRFGQANRCLFIDILCEGSREEHIYNLLMKGINVSDRILEHLERAG